MSGAVDVSSRDMVFVSRPEIDGDVLAPLHSGFQVPTCGAASDRQCRGRVKGAHKDVPDTRDRYAPSSESLLPIECPYPLLHLDPIALTPFRTVQPV